MFPLLPLVVFIHLIYSFADRISIIRPVPVFNWNYIFMPLEKFQSNSLTDLASPKNIKVINSSIGVFISNWKNPTTKFRSSNHHECSFRESRIRQEHLFLASATDQDMLCPQLKFSSRLSKTDSATSRSFLLKCENWYRRGTKRAFKLVAA